MRIDVAGEVWFWRGPAPWYFVTIPQAQGDELAAVVSRVTYGWGMVPVSAQLADVTWTTSLFPQDGTYVLPLKADVRRRAGIELGDVVSVTLTVDLG